MPEEQNVEFALLMQAWHEGVRAQGKVYEPLRFLVAFVQQHEQVCSETFYQKVVEFYKAGYVGME
ncbi:hypothetical protein [Tengunoibacter tsumagoiensis]|uniref:Uncharacterized protein n=1 Tax=Tengunoibacter tsumagoiensis TaxID=2014871 RepID=A0A401ZZ59_9CHLR|nr:hypothetical protein [Tengunoibacter tsumagoiensis]GCE12113.1 hypothetical protein KTT_19720 [Tengunoibacter tsumagoiensis]